MKYFILTKKHINMIKYVCILILITAVIFVFFKSAKTRYVKTFSSDIFLESGLPVEKKNTNKDGVFKKILGFSFCNPSSILSEYLPMIDFPSSEPDKQPSEDIPKKTPEPEKQSVEEQTVISKSKIKNQTKYEIEIEEFENADLKINTKPTVLIVHTHTTESYAPEDESQYFINDSSRSCDNNKNMIAVGNVIENQLKEAGIDVIHNKTVHDYPVYNGAYGRSLATVNEELEKNKNINVVLDIHRDAIAANDGTQMKFVTDINGVKTAQVMLVVGTDGGGLKHPNWHDNLIFAAKLQKKAEEKYSGLMRPLNLREERFNQHTTSCSIIIEVGTNANKLSEAKEGARLIADCLTEILL